MQTSYNNTQLQSAGLVVRIGAFLIDMIFVNIVLLLIRGTITSFFNRVNIDVAGTAILFDYSFLDISVYLLQVLYFIVSTYLTGTTIGKKLFNLCVVSETDEKISLFSIVYRETIGRFFSGLFFSIGYIIVGIDKKKRGIHDFLGDTRVVYAMKLAPVVQPASSEPVVSVEQPQPMIFAVPPVVKVPAEQEEVVVQQEESTEAEREHIDETQ